MIQLLHRHLLYETEIYQHLLSQLIDDLHLLNVYDQQSKILLKNEGKLLEYFR
jgi:hypothetical protein